MATKKDKIISWISNQDRFKTQDITGVFGVSRQYVNLLVRPLVNEGVLIKIGSTRNSEYLKESYAIRHTELIPSRFSKTYKNNKLEEHKVLDEIEHKLPLLNKLKENIKSVFTYAFSEMLNNAIEHSKSDLIKVDVLLDNGVLAFSVSDSGVGVFRNIMEKRKLNSEVESIQDLLKGKITTMPKSHSGEGIFFTSKVGDIFDLDSFGYELVINNNKNDLQIRQPKKIKRGTRVDFRISTKSSLHLHDIFKKYTSIEDQGDYGFDTTEVKVKLYTLGGVHVSRSQARRILSGLEKFKLIIFDFDQVPMVGQAFADEIFRVFQNKNPDIKIESTNMNEGVRFMVERVENRISPNKKLFDA